MKPAKIDPDAPGFCAIVDPDFDEDWFGAHPGSLANLKLLARVERLRAETYKAWRDRSGDYVSQQPQRPWSPQMFFKTKSL